MEMKEVIQTKVQETEAVIQKYLPGRGKYQQTAIEAMNYSMLGEGKRVRPILMMETYRLFGGKSEVIEPFMAAIEMIHTYSLVHDDLPAMDNDDYRRGRKTTHIVYGEAMGILAGDALLNYAYETAARSFEMEPENINIGKAFEVLAKKAGIYGMVGGQVADVLAEGTIPDKELLDFVYELKTGALLESAMIIGAILAGATKNEQKIIEEIAREIGIAFQIQDDILDETSTMQILGKPIGSDERNKKSTYVSLVGIQRAKNEVEMRTEIAVKKLDSLVVKNTFLKEYLLFLVERKK
ncbi:MAG: polyprenyl synthetase family protein [Lachnospiraceae bacterium]